MITPQEALQRTIEHREIFHDEMLHLMRQIMKGEISPLMVAAILTGLRVKKETLGEIAAAATVMRELSTKVDTPHGFANRAQFVDIVGTGGDGAHTFNISTASMFVAAAAGATVAKHGNRSVSSKSGAADVLEAFRPAVVSFHFGLPAPDLLARVKSWGSLVLSSATTVAEAQWLQAHGADAIIAQGLEAGGHRGMFLTEDLSTQIGTFALLPQIVRAVEVPVIAAGGIATPAGVAAAKQLGASAVQIGTAFLCSHEAATSALHRAALQSPAAQHTALTNVFSGRPARGIVNRLMRELGPLCAQAPAFPMATAGIAPLRSAAEAQGSSDFTPLWSGQNASVCRTAAAADITRDFLRAWHAA